MKLLRLALRNLRRNGRRTLSTQLALTIGTAALLLFGGFVSDIASGLETAYVQRSGHLQLHREGYLALGSGNPTAFSIADSERLITALKNDALLKPMLRVVTPVLDTGGIAGNFLRQTSTQVMINGVIPDEQNRLQQWNDYHYPIATPPYPLAGSGENSALIGTGVARILGLCHTLKLDDCPSRAAVAAENDAAAPLDEDIAALAGQQTQNLTQQTDRQVDVLTTRLTGAPDIARLMVIDALNQGLQPLDNVYLAMHLATAQRLVFGAGDRRVTGIIIQLEHTDQIAAARARIEAVMAISFRDQPLELHDVFELNPMHGQIMHMFDTFFGLASLLVGIVAMFMIGNTMSMAVMERTTEIGTLRAMGVQRGGVIGLFITESLLMVLLGCGAGIALALTGDAALRLFSLRWIPPGMTYSVPLLANVASHPALIVQVSLGATCLAILAVGFAARRAASLNIIDALRHV